MEQKKGLKRNPIDKFYTKQETVNLCIDLVKKHVEILKNDLIIEPSAGNGSFIEQIKTLSNNYKFYDIEPENEQIIKQNFLDLDVGQIMAIDKTIHIIGNPPFGRQSSLAIKFIKKCCEFSKSISFILPKSFKKESMKKHFSLNYHLEKEIDLDNNSFMINGVENSVPCVFQIWIYHDEKRIIEHKMNPINFEFIKKNNHPDISFRRVGVNAGTITKDTDNKSIQSHYFIKFLNDKSIDENIEILKNIKFDFNNTVGPKSISKQELISEFNKYLI